LSKAALRILLHLLFFLPALKQSSSKIQKSQASFAQADLETAFKNLLLHPSPAICIPVPTTDEVIWCDVFDLFFFCVHNFNSVPSLCRTFAISSDVPVVAP